MSKIENSFKRIDKLYALQKRDQWMNNLHPLVKFVSCIFFIVIAVSLGKYQLDKMIVLAVFLFVNYAIADLSILGALWRVKLILPLVLVVGIFNPIFDRSPGILIGSVMVSAGWISMISLMLKGIYSVLSAYLLIATTSIEEICYALRKLFVPKIFCTVLLLIYRYLTIMGEEADRIMTAYLLRAPSQKGIHYKAWGPLVGQWMLRSFDRADRVYNGMVLRGFTGEFTPLKEYKANAQGIVYLVVFAALLLVVRLVPIFAMFG